MANEKRLIDANELLKTLQSHFGCDLAYYGRDLQFCQEAVEFAPTIDTAEIVRCERCIFFKPYRVDKYSAGECTHVRALMNHTTPLSYCSKGCAKN